MHAFNNAKPLKQSFCHEHAFTQGRREDYGGPRQIQKVGPHKMDCVRRVWGHAPKNFENLHALKCVLGAPEALFHACTQTYIPASCCLRLAVSDGKVRHMGP